MNPVEVVYIMSHISKSISFEWITREIDREKVNLKFILINDQKDTPIEIELKKLGVLVEFVPYYGKKSIFSCLISLFKILNQWKPQVVHTHLFEASLFGLLVAKVMGVKHRIHTRHHSTLHLDYFPKAVRYDRWINKLSTRIVSISPMVSDVLIKQENVDKSKIKYIPHGFDFEDFLETPQARVDAVKAKYNINNNEIVLGVISRFIEWKGVQYIIHAFSEVVKKYPKIVLVLANAKGPCLKEISDLIDKKYGLLENVRFIDFEEDIPALYGSFDVFIHTPVDKYVEAFGQIYVEAFLTKTPSVFTVSGIADQFVTRENAMIVDYKNSKSIAHAVLQILSDSNFKDNLVKEMQQTDVSEFSLSTFINRLEKLYVA